jgi:hypothetical protein
MSNIEKTKDKLLPEYHFDYSKAKPNRFATQQLTVTVTLDADVAKISTNAECRVIYRHFLIHNNCIK